MEAGEEVVVANKGEVAERLTVVVVVASFEILMFELG